MGLTRRRILQGLKEIHRLGLVHRDIKPQNICCGDTDRDGIRHKTWKLVDFGLVGKNAPQSMQQILTVIHH